MLQEPPYDPERARLDKAVRQAVMARLRAGTDPAPDAAALALRSLLAGSDPAMRAVIRAVWGRIEAEQTGAPLVCGGLSRLLAADRYGLGGQVAAEPEAALSAISKGGQALIDLSGVRPWWGRLLALPHLRIIAGLPDDRAGLPQALMVAARPTGPTGDDRTFWVTDANQSDLRIVEALGLAGLAATPLASAGGLKLFMLAGYVQAEDARLTAAPGLLSGVIGAAPQF